MEIISKQKQFLEICHLIKTKKIVAIDSEFVRENTYLPILCLLQLNVNNRCYIIDCLADDIDINPFLAIIDDENINKIFHCARQDLEVLLQNFPKKFVPKAITDTQIMASFCDFGFVVSYGNLVKDLLDKELDKDCQRSDWQRRPLSDNQVQYALNDVLYLPEIHQILQDRLLANKRSNWVEEEMRVLIKNATNDDLARNFAVANRDANYRQNVNLLVKWRDDLAKKYDVPRSFVIKDDLLSKIANFNPKTPLQLQKCNFRSRLPIDVRDDLLNLMIQKTDLKSDRIRKKFDSELRQKQKEIYQQSKLLLYKQAKEYNLRPELIINQSNLQNIIYGYKSIPSTLAGWRYIVFGKELETLID